MGRSRGVALATMAAIALPALAQAAEPAGVTRVDPQTGTRSVASANVLPVDRPEFVSPVGVAVESDGDILVADAGIPAVLRVDPRTGLRRVVSSNARPPTLPAFSTGLGGLVGIALEADGHAIVLDVEHSFGCPPGCWTAFRVDPQTGEREALAGSLGTPAALAIAGDGGIFVAVEGGPVALLMRIDPETGETTTVPSNQDPPPLQFPKGLAFGAGGQLLAAESFGLAGNDGGVIAVDPDTGARSVVSANDDPPGQPLFETPYAIVLEPGGGLALLNGGGGEPQVIRVNPLTGTRSLISSNADPPGLPALFRPTAIASEADGDLLVADAFAYPDFYPLPTCHGESITVLASGEGAIRGTPKGDVIAGTGRDDRIRAGAGRDIVCGRRGDDRLRGGSGRDRLDGGPGRDRCIGGPGRDRLSSCG